MATTEVVMSGNGYRDEFKYEAAKQVLELGRPVRKVAIRSGISADSLYLWVRNHRKSPTRFVRSSIEGLALVGG